MHRSQIAVASTLFSVACFACGDGTSVSDHGSSGEASATYYQDVLPILQKHCLSCHNDSGLGPFSLETIEDATAPGMPEAIKEQTASRTMPPWLADNGGACNTYREARWLTNDEIAKLGQWVDEGLAVGNPVIFAPPLPPFAPNARVDTGGEYTPSGDEYRCFIVNPLIDDAPEYLTGWRGVPGEPSEVRGATLFALDAETQEQKAVELDALDEEVLGYDCKVGAQVAGARFVAAFSPGSALTQLPEGTGVQLNPGRPMVLRVHYSPRAEALPDQTRVELVLTKTVERVVTVVPFGVTEFSVPPGQAAGEVSRSAALSDDYPALSATQATVVGVAPDMRSLGVTLRLDAGGAKNACLLATRRWDLRYVQSFFYEAPAQISTTDALTLRCAFNTTGSSAEVRSGDAGGEERCRAYLYLEGLPATFVPTFP